jgi:Beta-galactosidase
MRLLTLLALIPLLFLLFVPGCGDDDDDDTGDDDAAPGDDDDDSSSDDDDDNDATDDDDDDNDDDDTGPYDQMVPDGKMLDGILGISSHMSRGTAYSWKREFEIEKLVEAGMTMVRNDFHWYTIEPQDDVWYFDGLDTMVDLCLAAGLEVTAIFLGAPDWATPGGSPDEIDPVKYADYAGQVAAHFADRIDYYEFWNEANSSRFWPEEPNPAKYGEVMKAAYTAVHDNDPDASLIFGGLSPLDLHIFDPHGVWNFLYRVYEEHSDICDYFDVMSIHPYTFLQQPGPEHGYDVLFYHFPSVPEMVELVRSILGEMGCPDKPIQFTEVGWPSYFITDMRQAAYLSRSMMMALAQEIEIYDWYTFWDGSGTASPITEDYFGLFTHPDQYNQTTAKASYEALVGVHSVIGDAQYAGDLGANLGWESGKYALVFANDLNVWTVGFWHRGFDFYVEKTMTLPLPADAVGTWTIFDQEGTEVASGDVSGGAVEVELTGRVGYLQFTRGL